MTVQIVVARRARTGRAVRRILGRFALAAIGASLGAISISTFGADLATGSSRSITGPSQVTRADHRPITAQPSAPPDTKLDYLAAHGRMVDQLYGGADALDAARVLAGFDQCLNGGQMLSVVVNTTSAALRS